jgi:hypothetical protein
MFQRPRTLARHHRSHQAFPLGLPRQQHVIAQGNHFPFLPSTHLPEHLLKQVHTPSLHHLRIIFSFLAQRPRYSRRSGSLLRRAVGIRLSSSSAFFKKQEAGYVNAPKARSQRRRRKKKRSTHHHSSRLSLARVRSGTPDLRFLCE